MAENEIIAVSKEAPVPKVVTMFNPVSLMPKTFNEKYQMAKILATSGLIPQGLNTPEKVCVALEWGHELQLSPMVAVNNITVINGKPTLSVDIMSAIVKRSPEFGGIEWKELTDKAAECVVTRKSMNYEEKTSSRFTFDDAVKAGLTGKDVWKKYPKRMLKHRCLSYGLRDAFPDILAGLYSPEEMESISKPGVPTERNVMPREQYMLEYEPNSGDVTPADIQSEKIPAVDMGQVQQEEPPINYEFEESRSYLATTIQKYRNNLRGQPYDLANQALQSNDLNQIKTMTKRVTDYLGRQGILVEGA